ncbi:hypothetical protein EWF20_03260 [Sulfolobus sp. S-194]|uniref:hypothetical protein n=1 Tax=Sulfolobus sp. S-194 TaxID=2512240 RepID=UPI001436E05F|nr:hypothetical protein [Sulfolobus sp. S-194]QIW23256.1 hypothetical protein EWF20_03260 [Sulfolobus sp. S-194]
MIVPVFVSRRSIEELCYAEKEFGETVVYCDDYEADHEYTVDEVEFDEQDLEDIIDEYLEDILEILKKNYKKKLSVLLKADSGKF